MSLLEIFLLKPRMRLDGKKTTHSKIIEEINALFIQYYFL
jgi:hypothetical protein